MDQIISQKTLLKFKSLIYEFKIFFFYSFDFFHFEFNFWFYFKQKLHLQVEGKLAHIILLNLIYFFKKKHCNFFNIAYNLRYFIETANDLLDD